jgi:hypothetical protein
MLLQMSIPIAGEQSGRSNIPFCFPEPSGENTFVCGNLNWDVPINEECWVQVSDPLLGRAVATSIFLNGQRLQRVDVLPNGTEFGRFRVTSVGHVR